MKRVIPFIETLFAVFLAAAVKGVINQYIPTDRPFLLYFSAIIFSAWRGGTLMGLVATGLSFLMTALQYPLLRGEPLDSVTNLTQICLFFIDGASIAFIGGAFLRVKKSSDRFLNQFQKTQSSLLESEKRYRALFDSNLTGILLGCPDGKILEANDYFLNLMQVTREEFQLDGLNWRKLSPPEQIPEAERSMEILRQQGMVAPTERVYLRKDGSRVSVLLGLARLDEGRMIAYASDLTAQKAYERQLAEASVRLEERVNERTQQLLRSQKFLDSIIEYIPNMIFVKSAANLRFVRFNRAGSELLGISQEELIGKSDTDFFPPDQAEHFIEKDRAVLNDKVVLDIPEEQIETKNGRRYLHTKKIPILDEAGNPEYLLGISEDITERKEIENQRVRLYQEQAARMSAEKTAAEMGFMSEVSGVLTETLDLPRMLDMLAEKIVGHMADWCEISLLDDQGKAVQHIAIAHQDPETKKRLLAWREANPISEDQDRGLWRVIKSGSAEFYRCIADVPGANENPAVKEWGLRSAMMVPIRVFGRTVGAIGFSMAESGRYYEEIDLSIAQDVARRAFFTIENARLFDQAQESNRAKSAFLANVSHEIRTPLGAMLGFAELLLDEKSLEPAQIGSVETILRNGRQLLHIVDEILDITKVESGGLNIENVTCSISNLIDEVMGLLAGMASDKGLQLLLKRKSFLPEQAITDPSRLRQILINVIGNAIKFTEKGSIEVKVDMRPSPLSQHRILFIEVQDTGIGIAPEQGTRLFSAFTQADNSMTRRFGGTGLGLFLARRLARLLGGDIVLQHSVPGQGSSFAITIDVQIPAESVKLPVSVPSKSVSPLVSAGPRGSVLVVDDSADNRELVAHYLARLGFETEIASSGMEALEKSSRFKFQIVLMDLQMPGMDGFEALREMRNRNYDGPIVALTAHAMKGDRERCMEAGFDDYLCKPIDRKALTQTLGRFVTTAVPQ